MSMERKLPLELIFPVKDKASARLMALKADHLLAAHLIGEQEWAWVQARVRSVSAEPRPAGGSFPLSVAGEPNEKGRRPYPR